MPRTTPRSKKIKWADKADSGMSPAEIRAEENPKPDVRTVENAIREIQAERRRTKAREAALHDGLREHWRILLDALSSIPVDVDCVTSFGTRPAFRESGTVVAGSGWSARRSGDGWTVSFGFDEQIESELLREHLKGDSFWRVLDDYRSALERFIGARFDLVTEVRNIVSREMEQAGLFSNQKGETAGPETAGLARIDEALAGYALAGAGAPVPELDGRYDPDGGLYVGDSLLVPKDSLLGRAGTEKIRASFSDALDKTSNGVMKADAWRELLTAGSALDRRRKHLAREVSVLQISTVLPGECASCTRYSA